MIGFNYWSFWVLKKTKSKKVAVTNNVLEIIQTWRVWAKRRENSVFEEKIHVATNSKGMLKRKILNEWWNDRDPHEKCFSYLRWHKVINVLLKKIWWPSLHFSCLECQVLQLHNRLFLVIAQWLSSQSTLFLSIEFEILDLLNRNKISRFK